MHDTNDAQDALVRPRRPTDGREGTRGTAVPALLGAFWFGVQVVWGAILSIVLQARSVDLAHDDGLRNFAFLSAGGAAVAATTQIVIGLLADRRRSSIAGHRLEFYFAGTICTIPALVWLFLTPSYAGLAVAFLLMQLWMNVAVGPYQAVIPDYIEAARTGTASSWLSVYQFVGLTVGVILAGFVSDFRILAAALAIILLAALAPTLLPARSLRSLATATEPLTVNANVRTSAPARPPRGFVNLGSLTLLNFLFFYVAQSLRSPDPRRDTGVLFLSYMLSGIAGALLSAKPTNAGDKRVVVTVATAITSLGLILLRVRRSRSTRVRRVRPSRSASPTTSSCWRR